MGVSFMLYRTDTEGNHQPVEHERFGIHWTYSSWAYFRDGVLNALKDAYVVATKVRNDARRSWENEENKSDKFWLDSFEDAAANVQRLADLKTYWVDGDNPDEQVDAVWSFDKAKVIECLFEALVIDSEKSVHPFVERDRLAWVLRYLTVNDGDHLVVA